ncbi:ribonuclease H2 subunit A-like isoform X2 [Halichondria panicea]
MASEEASSADLFLADTLFSRSLQSQVPASSRDEECCLGIDEAGRGPVLGPMVYGAAFCPVSKKQQVKDLGVADSKVLKEHQRDKLFKDINSSGEYIGWKVEVLSPNHISNSMLQRTKYSLNALSHDAAIGLIRRTLADGVKLTEVYVDTVGDPGKYEAKLSDLFPQLSITVAKKADALYPIVSAASICAKVIRDECLKRWKFVEEEFGDSDLGSGYPADPNTKSWLGRNIDPVFGYPTVVRFSWATCQTILDAKAVDVQW